MSRAPAVSYTAKDYSREEGESVEERRMKEGIEEEEGLEIERRKKGGKERKREAENNKSYRAT